MSVRHQRYTNPRLPAILTNWQEDGQASRQALCRIGMPALGVVLAIPDSLRRHKLKVLGTILKILFQHVFGKCFSKFSHFRRSFDFEIKMFAKNSFAAGSITISDWDASSHAPSLPKTPMASHVPPVAGLLSAQQQPSPSPTRQFSVQFSF